MPYIYFVCSKTQVAIKEKEVRRFLQFNKIIRVFYKDNVESYYEFPSPEAATSAFDSIMNQLQKLEQV